MARLSQRIEQRLLSASLKIRARKWREFHVKQRRVEADGKLVVERHSNEQRPPQGRVRDCCGVIGPGRELPRLKLSQSRHEITVVEDYLPRLAPVGEQT